MAMLEADFHEFLNELEEVSVPYRIAIPSYNRPVIFREKTLAYLDRCNVNADIDVFLESPEQCGIYLNELHEDYPGLNYIITNTQGICEKRNFIRYYYAMENYNRYTFCLDDDIDTVMRKDKTEETELDDFIIRGFLECDNVGATMFGISPLHNEFFLRDKISYNLNYIIGAFFGFVSEEGVMPYMTDMEHYEDFDFSLAHYFKDKKLVRFNHLGLKTKYFEPTGGITYQMGGLQARQQYMDENAEYMREKWGDVVKVTKNKWGTGLKLNHLHRFNKNNNE
jgi:hypothetical protein